MSDIDHTANLILNRTEDTESRVNGYYVHLRHLKAMAGFWRMRKEIVNVLLDLTDLADDELGKDVDSIKAFIKQIKALEETNENKQ